MKSLYVIARKPLDVTDLRQFVSTQIEGKALEAAHPGTQTFRQFREYRAAFCQPLGIPDEKALGRCTRSSPPRSSATSTRRCATTCSTSRAPSSSPTRRWRTSTTSPRCTRPW
ncbi:hypothetical protein [Brachybacterium sp. GPGPB12]|uniref:hypothetical protein n=1 Tax=Brachybacterium sp. GPGPB12 TaxID=3023517 RepID=UPI00313445E8